MDCSGMFLHLFYVPPPHDMMRHYKIRLVFKTLTWFQNVNRSLLLLNVSYTSISRRPFYIGDRC